MIQSDLFYPLVGGHQQPLKGSLNHPKKVTSRIARLALETAAFSSRGARGPSLQKLPLLTSRHEVGVSNGVANCSGEKGEHQ